MAVSHCLHRRDHCVRPSHCVGRRIQHDEQTVTCHLPFWISFLSNHSSLSRASHHHYSHHLPSIPTPHQYHRPYVSILSISHSPIFMRIFPSLSMHIDFGLKLFSLCVSMHKLLDAVLPSPSFVQRSLHPGPPLSLDPNYYLCYLHVEQPRCPPCHSRNMSVAVPSMPPSANIERALWPYASFTPSQIRAPFNHCKTSQCPIFRFCPAR